MTPSIKRWWANQCAHSATGLDIGRLIATLQTLQTEARELRDENRRLAAALRAIRDHEQSVLSGMHEYSPVWALAEEAIGNLHYSVAHIEAATDKRLASGIRAAAVQTLKTGTKKPWYHYRRAAQ